MNNLEQITEDSISGLSLEELEDLVLTLSLEHSELDSEQNALKLNGNSCFGALGSPSCMWFNRDIAEAITLSGQYTIHNVSNAIDKYFKSIVPEVSQYVIYNDTDSSFVNLGPIVEKFCNNKTVSEKEKFVDTICSTKIASLISKTLDHQEQYMNSMVSGVLKVKRENIADKAIVVASKNYILQVVNKEGGIHLNEPKLKLTGISAVRTSTPISCRKKIPEMIEAIFSKDEQTVQGMIAEFRREFESINLTEVAKPTGVNNIATYYDEKTRKKFPKIPIGVRAAVNFNEYIEDNKLESFYRCILEGDKINFLYLKLPNPLNQDVIGFKDELPTRTMEGEYNLANYIDWDKQFEVCLLKPMELILNPIGWHTEKFTTLEDLFG